MNSVYVDTFSDDLELITLARLESDYDEFKRNGEFDDYATFAEYVNACLFHNNGALLPVSECVVRGDYNDSLSLELADCVYILRKELHLINDDIWTIRAECGHMLNHITRPELIDLVNDYMNH